MSGHSDSFRPRKADPRGFIGYQADPRPLSAVKWDQGRGEETVKAIFCRVKHKFTRMTGDVLLDNEVTDRFLVWELMCCHAVMESTVIVL